MTMDNVELKEYTGETYGRDNKISSNRLKLRSISFKSVSSKWRDYLKSILESKLEKEKENLVETEYKPNKKGSLASESKKEIKNTSEKIARLEEWIKIVSLENVPKKYRKRRAIKLKKDMFSLLYKNSSGLYVINSQDKDKIFSNDELSNNLNKIEEKIPNYINYNYVYKNSINSETKPEEIDIKEISNITKDDIKSDIDKAMSELEKNKEEEKNEATINREQIIAAIDSHYGNIYETTDTGYTVSDSHQNEEKDTNIIINSEPTEEIYTQNVRDNVVVIDDTRNKNTVDDKEDNKEQEEVVEQNHDKFKMAEPTEENVNNDEESVIKELEKLSMAIEDFERSENEFNETNLRVKQEQDEAQKVTQEKLEGKNKQRELIEKIQREREEYAKRAKENRESIASMNESIDKTRRFIESERLAINNYNNQINKMSAALAKLSSKEFHQLTSSTNENKALNVVSQNNSVPAETRNEYNNWMTEPPKQIDSDLDEALRIINNVDNSTLTQLRWARDVIDFAERYTKPETISAEKNEPLDSYGVMHAPSSYFGVQTSDSNAFDGSYSKGR